MFDLDSDAMRAVCALERREWHLERAGVPPEPSAPPPPPRDVLEVVDEMLHGRPSSYRGQAIAGKSMQMPSPRPGLPARAEVG